MLLGFVRTLPSCIRTQRAAWTVAFDVCVPPGVSGSGIVLRVPQYKPIRFADDIWDDDSFLPGREHREPDTALGLGPGGGAIVPAGHALVPARPALRIRPT